MFLRPLLTTYAEGLSNCEQQAIAAMIVPHQVISVFAVCF